VVKDGSRNEVMSVDAQAPIKKIKIKKGLMEKYLFIASWGASSVSD
jgi:hypothetical protein